MRSVEPTGPPLATRKLGELKLQGDQLLAAASGLVSCEDQLFVVPDDGLSLGCFERSLEHPGVARPMFADPPLPEDHAARKKAKPDMESLTAIPPGSFGFPERSLLSLGSGSTENRQRGVVLSVAGGEPRPFDLQPLYAHLRAQLPELNIEGLALQGNLLRLLQRGNGDGSPNALIDLDAPTFFRQLHERGAVGPEALRAVREVDLGSLQGVKLTFTDLAPTPDGHFLFTASAEDTSNPYDDGQVMGSVLGRLHRDGTVETMRPLDREVKVEGVDLGADGQIRLVTDADDPGRPAEVFSLDDARDFLLAR